MDTTTGPRIVGRLLARMVAVVLRAGRQGSSFGARTRLPHALVLSIMFGRKSQSLLERWKDIAEATMEHGKNIAVFAAIYKASIAIMRILEASLGARGSTSLGELLQDMGKLGRPPDWRYTAIAAFLGASAVWSKRTKVNQQILFYLIARVLYGVFVAVSEGGIEPFHSISFPQAYPYLAIGIWIAVMVLFEHFPSSLQGSLSQAMQTIYHDADTVGEDSFFREFVPNVPFLLAALTQLLF